MKTKFFIILITFLILQTPDVKGVKVEVHAIMTDTAAKRSVLSNSNIQIQMTTFLYSDQQISTLH